MSSATTSVESGTRGGTILFRILFSTFIVIAVALFLFVTLQPITVLPRVNLSPGFSFLDQNGEVLSNEMLRGSVVLYTFTYTNCTGDCPDLETMVQVQQLVKETNTGEIPVRLVTIFIDPERDSNENLAAYAEQFGADDQIWHLVTGRAAELKAVVGGGFNTYYTHLDDGTIRLDPAFILVDGTGITRAEYRTAVPDIDIIMRDIGLVVEEAENSKGLNKYAYDAARLFLCYP